VAGLDGVWEVERTGGALPPLVGCRKRIHGSRGSTVFGPLPGVPFEVRGNELHYRSPFGGFVDEETATAAREIIEEEQAMADKIASNCDRFAELSLRDAGVPA
jgi:hypothetical protein